MRHGAERMSETAARVCNLAERLVQFCRIWLPLRVTGAVSWRLLLHGSLNMFPVDYRVDPPDVAPRPQSVRRGMTRSAQIRRCFLAAFWKELRVIWPIVSGLIGVQLILGLVVGRLEGWAIGAATYFTFVTGLTIGYGDLVPERFATRLISVLIGIIGILLSGLVAAIGVRALQEATSQHED
jgi:hypothetical protein